MKKLLSMILALTMLISCFSCVAFADDEIKILLNGNELVMDQSPVIVEGRTLVPLRAIFESLGAKVEWDDSTKTATGILGDITVSLQINNTNAKINGKDIALDVPAQIVNSRTLVPVRFISESLGCKVDWDANTRTVIITSSASKEWNFDNVSSFELDKDFVTGAAYEAKNVSLSKDVDHTSGSGQSLKMAGRTQIDYRVKFIDAFAKEDLGKVFNVSAYVYGSNEGTNVLLGAYGAQGSANAFAPVSSAMVNIKANEWTLIEFKYEHTNDSITQLGVCQKGADAKLIETLYIDDVKITEIAGADADIKENEFTPVKAIDGKRPVPTEFTKSSDLRDLIYYDIKNIEDIIPTLPQGEVILTNEEFLNGNAKNAKISTEIVDVEGQEFNKAIRITCPEKTPNIYDAQYEIPLTRNFKPGDMGMLVVSSRKISGGDNDTNVGGIQFVIEQAETPWYKALQQDGVVVQNEWTKSYMPFNVNESLGTNVHMTVRVGHFSQVLEIGGVEIINYKDAVTAEQLPSTKTYEGMEEGAQWREEALQRIEKIRKGDFKLVIKDENGNIIPNANIKVNMTEHEFEWGTAVNTPLLAEGQAGEIYRSNLIKYFNSAVLENHMKWTYYETDPTIARKLVDTLKDIGIKNIRGHALVWDKSSLSGNGINSSLPPRVLEATEAKDRDKVQGYIKEHMTKIMEEYKDDLVEWDTTNELFRDDTFIRNVFGNDIVVEWFNMANEANVGNQKIYMNEHQMVGTDNYLDKLVPLLEELKAKGAKWDGIGSQAHFAFPCYPPKFYDQLEVLGKYADELKITEYDFSINDENIHASFTRDILITIFSHEKVQGFYCWGFVDGGKPIYLLFDKNWNRKKTADQYEDLVYNKWWTRESGATNANGEFDVRAFYGDYDITVNVGGVEKTINVPLRKANAGTVEVIVK